MPEEVLSNLVEKCILFRLHRLFIWITVLGLKFPCVFFTPHLLVCFAALRNQGSYKLLNQVIKDAEGLAMMVLQLSMYWYHYAE